LNFHLLDQTGDARIAFIIAAVGVLNWAIVLAWNIRWLQRANGHRPFVKAFLLLNGGAALLALSFAYNSARTMNLSDDPWLRLSFMGNRALVTLGSLVILSLRRDINRRKM